MNNERRGILVVLAVAIVAIVLACTTPLLFKKDNDSAQAEKQTLPRVVTAKGVVESQDEIILSSRVVSIIKHVMVDEGDTVRRGQPLVIFDGSKATANVKQGEAKLFQAEAAYNELKNGNRKEDVEASHSNMQRADATLKNANEEYARQQRLFSKGATSLVELQKAEETLKVAQATYREAAVLFDKSKTGARTEEIERAKRAVSREVADVQHSKAVLADYSIYSPINGLVVQKILDVGESTDIGTPVLKLIDPQRLRVRAELEETDVGKVSEGQNVEAFSDAYPNKVFKGKVTKVFPIVQKKTQKSFDPMASFDINIQKVHITLANYDGLRDGMTLTVRVAK